MSQRIHPTSPFASTAVGTGSRCVRLQPGAFNLLCLKCRHGLKPGNAAVGSRDHLALPVALSFRGFLSGSSEGKHLPDLSPVISLEAY